MGLLVAFIFLGIVIFFHEFGHYIFAKLSGCAVSRFSLGFGPKLFGFKKRETEYCFSLLPIWGGYVKLVGMEGEVMAGNEKEVESAREFGLKTYEQLSAWRRLSILLGGILVQCLLCVLILTLVVAFIGRPVTSGVIVAQSLPDSPALKAGLKQGDEIISIDGQKILSAQQMIELIAKKPVQSMEFAIRRNSEELVVQITPELNPEHGRVMIGVQLSEMIEYSKKGMGLIDCLADGVVLTYKITVRTLQGLWFLITRRVSLGELMGPIGLIKVTSVVARTGFLNLITFFAAININIAILNVLPIPAVDGGHVTMLLCEKIFRRRIPARAKEVINYVGFGLIIMLMLLVSLNDIKKLTTGYFKKLEILMEDGEEKE